MESTGPIDEPWGTRTIPDQGHGDRGGVEQTGEAPALEEGVAFGEVVGGFLR